MGKTVAIIAALESEIRPLVRHWERSRIEYDGRQFLAYESSYAVVISAGIGAESARWAAEAVVAAASPQILVSAGFAGALVRELRVGDTIFPALIIDTQDGSRHESAIAQAVVGTSGLGRTILASHPRIASRREKQQLGKSYGAHAVDMEAAAILRAAERHALPFVAVKTISDEVDFELPEMNRFLRQGGFRTRRFLLYLALRPWHWAKALRLASSSRRAAENLCAWLRESALRTTIIPSALAQTDPDGHRNPADLSSPAREDSDHHAGGRLPRSR